MKRIIVERRANKRYELRFPLRYRISQKGVPAYAGISLTLDLSASGIAFRCRKPLPVGSHIELLVDWPTKYRDSYPIELHVTGFVLRSANGRTAVRMTSHRLRVSEAAAHTVHASA
jgi:PilZ domain